MFKIFHSKEITFGHEITTEVTALVRDLTLCLCGWRHSGKEKAKQSFFAPLESTGLKPRWPESLFQTPTSLLFQNFECSAGNFSNL